LSKMFQQLDVPPEFSVNVDLPGPGRSGTSQGVTVKTEKQGRRAKRTVKSGTTNRTRKT
jgi:hypothetical protein